MLDSVYKSLPMDGGLHVGSMKDHILLVSDSTSKTFNSTVPASDKTSSQPRRVTRQRLIYLKLTLNGGSCNPITLTHQRVYEQYARQASSNCLNARHAVITRNIEGM